MVKKHKSLLCLLTSFSTSIGVPFHSTQHYHNTSDVLGELRFGAVQTDRTTIRQTETISIQPPNERIQTFFLKSNLPLNLTSLAGSIRELTPGILNTQSGSKNKVVDASITHGNIPMFIKNLFIKWKNTQLIRAILNMNPRGKHNKKPAVKSNNNPPIEMKYTPASLVKKI